MKIPSPVVRLLPLLACTVAAAALCASAAAQGWPAKAIRIVTNEAGAGLDFSARLLAQGLSERFRQPVIVDNRGGAGGIIAGEMVAKAAPDGYTLIFFSNGLWTVPLLQKTPLKIHGLYLNPDGTFPNHPANPLEFANLRDLIDLVKKESLDCGIAFDGDGDRAFMVDENGEVVSGSILGALLAEHFLQLNPGATVLQNAITSRVVSETVKEMGGESIRTKVGHSFIKAEMRKYNAVFACEHSGHYYFKDNYNADSGLIAALCILNIMSTSGRTLSELCEPYRSRYVDSGEINFKIENIAEALDEVAGNYTDGTRDDLDGMTISYPDWWFNLRPSNTEPLLRLNIEARSQSVVDDNLDKIKKILQK